MKKTDYFSVNINKVNPTTDEYFACMKNGSTSKQFVCFFLYWLKKEVIFRGKNEKTEVINLDTLIDGQLAGHLTY